MTFIAMAFYHKPRIADCLSVAVVNIFKEQQEQIKVQAKQIPMQQEQITQPEQQLNQKKNLIHQRRFEKQNKQIGEVQKNVCSTNPQLKICKK
ncbi:MAG: hypothetical protein ACRD6X_12520 [Pyrinomonadaceae bacterium]